MGVVETGVQPHGENGAPRQKAPEPGTAAYPSLVARCAVARPHQTAADAALQSLPVGPTPSELVGAATVLRAARHLGTKSRSARTAPERLIAEAAPENKDIRFVSPIQDAVIKLETFLCTHYSMVTANAMNDETRVAIFPVTPSPGSTHHRCGRQAPQAGSEMNLLAEIKWGSY
jgi:hypothetical protein